MHLYYNVMYDVRIRLLVSSDGSFTLERHKYQWEHKLGLGRVDRENEWLQTQDCRKKTNNRSGPLINVP